MKKTYTIDATGRVLGRLAAEIAILLRGKNRPDFVHHLDLGNSVIVTNTSKIRVTGKKAELKKYYRHSGYVGGIKEIKYKDLFNKDPNKVLRKAIYGMLPKNKLRAKMMKRLKLFEHAKDQNNN